MLLTAGQDGDNPMLAPLVTAHQAGPGRGVRLHLLADKAYSHPSTRKYLRRRKIQHTIPERRDQIARRVAKGSAGGRPAGFNAELYKLRNTVERGYNRFKQWRGIATRYDKTAVNFHGGVILAAVMINHRVLS